MICDWESNQTEIFLNPRGKTIQLPHLDGHIWLATSGTQQQKYVALSKKAFLISAKAVNDHLQSTSQDIWLNPLPTFHVGGLAIHARAYLTDSQVLTIAKWDPHHYYQTLQNATLTSLVPTQVYDLLTLNLPAPPKLRAVIVGGGYLTDFLYQKGISLGWPLLPSYGLTECCSQVATATPNNRQLKILNHVTVKSDGNLKIKSPSLFTTFAHEDPKEDGWYRTSDTGTVEGSILTITGRADGLIKISGELVSISSLQYQLEEILHQQTAGNGFALRIIPDERLGHKLQLMTNSNNPQLVMQIYDTFNLQVMPYERIREIIPVESINRNALGKIIT